MVKVIVYTTETCYWCTEVKKWLREHKVRFEEKDVNSDRAAAREMIQKSGQTGVPVIDANGTMIIGFDVKALREALGI